MANRAMEAKLRRARHQAREAAQLEFTKPAYILQTPKHELRAMASRFDGAKVHHIPAPTAPKRPPRLYGDGTRRGSILTPDVYSTEARLIRVHHREGLHG
jgi:hypothetical protein